MMGTESRPFATLLELLEWCRQAPRGTLLDAQQVAEVLSAGHAESMKEHPETPTENEDGPGTWTWREKLWTVPAETRLGVTELSEALGRPRSFVYARTQKQADDPIPHRKLDGALVFTAGEVRAWVRARENVVQAGPMESTDAERSGRLHAI